MATEDRHKKVESLAIEAARLMCAEYGGDDEGPDESSWREGVIELGLSAVEAKEVWPSYKAAFDREMRKLCDSSLHYTREIG